MTRSAHASNRPLAQMEWTALSVRQEVPITECAYKLEKACFKRSLWTVADVFHRSAAIFWNKKIKRET